MKMIKLSKYPLLIAGATILLVSCRDESVRVSAGDGLQPLRPIAPVLTTELSEELARSVPGSLLNDARVESSSTLDGEVVVRRYLHKEQLIQTRIVVARKVDPLEQFSDDEITQIEYGARSFHPATGSRVGGEQPKAQPAGENPWFAVTEPTELRALIRCFRSSSLETIQFIMEPSLLRCGEGNPVGMSVIRNSSVSFGHAVGFRIYIKNNKEPLFIDGMLSLNQFDGFINNELLGLMNGFARLRYPDKKDFFSASADGSVK